MLDQPICHERQVIIISQNRPHSPKGSHCNCSFIPITIYESNRNAVVGKKVFQIKNQGQYAEKKNNKSAINASPERNNSDSRGIERDSLLELQAPFSK